MEVYWVFFHMPYFFTAAAAAAAAAATHTNTHFNDLVTAIV